MMQRACHTTARLTPAPLACPALQLDAQGKSWVCGTDFFNSEVWPHLLTSPPWRGITTSESARSAIYARGRFPRFKLLILELGCVPQAETARDKRCCVAGEGG